MSAGPAPRTPQGDEGSLQDEVAGLPHSGLGTTGFRRRSPSPRREARPSTLPCWAQGQEGEWERLSRGAVRGFTRPPAAARWGPSRSRMPCSGLLESGLPGTRIRSPGFQRPGATAPPVMGGRREAVAGGAACRAPPSHPPRPRSGPAAGQLGTPGPRFTDVEPSSRLLEMARDVSQSTLGRGRGRPLTQDKPLPHPSATVWLAFGAAGCVQAWPPWLGRRRPGLGRGTRFPPLPWSRLLSAPLRLLPRTPTAWQAGWGHTRRTPPPPQGSRGSGPIFLGETESQGDTEPPGFAEFSRHTWRPCFSGASPAFQL